MKRLWLLSACVLLVFSSRGAVADLTYKFDPNDLLDLYPAVAGDEDVSGENKATQANARRVHAAWAGTWYETFYNPASPHTQPDDYNTYMNWRAGLGQGEGISAFNIWLLDNPNARSWGESTVWDPNGSAPTGTADADGKWNVEVIANPWGAGWLVQWWTEDSNYLLRPGGDDIGEFSFSGAAFYDTNQNAYDVSDPAVQAGDLVRVWFGSYWGAQPGDWDPAEHSLAFDNVGFGTLSPNYGTFQPTAGVDGSNVGWEGVLEIEAVPEPLTCLLFAGSVLGGLGAWRRRRGL